VLESVMMRWKRCNVDVDTTVSYRWRKLPDSVTAIQNLYGRWQVFYDTSTPYHLCLIMIPLSQPET
jgi:hypothetical protein